VNGAVSLLSTLSANGVEVCFANPGTSEMHFVAALDAVPSFRGVLCLFEGVATGAADGYARVTGQPAATLLHLGPGLGNGLANLHNARRARVPLINIVGDHATYHTRFDAPLHSDIDSVAKSVSGWFRRSARPDDVAGDAASAVAAALAPPGQISTLVLPADASWGELTSTPTSWPTIEQRFAAPPTSDQLERAAKALRSPKSAMLIGGDALRRDALALAGRLSAATGARLYAETFSRSQDHGAGVFAPERLIYLSEFAIDQLKDVETLVLVGATEPVGFFAYPNVPSRLTGPGCQFVTAAAPGTDVTSTLRALVDEIGAPELPGETGDRPGAPTGELTPSTTAAALGATMPTDVIVVDEAATGGIHLMGATRFAPPHLWLTLTGGAIGYGLPAALGAAVGGGGRRVICVEADGSMMYTPQALWSMAREGLDVTVIALSNRSYGILNLELQRVGATSEGAASRRMLDLDNPELQLADLARSLGVPAERVTTADALVSALQRSFSTPGPTFIEVMHRRGLG
jgi:acetolactate synthase I/II/III large subunit